MTKIIKLYKLYIYYAKGDHKWPFPKCLQILWAGSWSAPQQGTDPEGFSWLHQEAETGHRVQQGGGAEAKSIRATKPSVALADTGEEGHKILGFLKGNWIAKSYRRIENSIGDMREKDLIGEGEKV